MAGVWGFYPQKCAVMGPAQFGTHCVPNWKRLIKVPHVAQVAFIKAFPKREDQKDALDDVSMMQGESD
jgi:hypothetical protein